MSNINEVVKQLGLFSKGIIELNKPATEDELLAFEKVVNFFLPTDYRAFLKIHNGFSLMGVTVYGVGNSNRVTLQRVFEIEHNEVGNPMPSYFIPFSPNGMGDHYCFDMRSYTAESCPVIFWQHDYMYTEIDSPEVVSNGYADWVQNVLIDRTLEDYDYNGNEK